MKRTAQFRRILMLVLGAVAAMFLVTVGMAHADVSETGTTAGGFLEVGSGPRILGMGGATLGLGQDLAGASWNAAALGWVSETAVTISHVGLENQSFQEWAAIGGRVGQSNSRWSISGLFQGDGSFEARDASNNPIGSVSASSYAIGGHLAQQLGSMTTVGLGFKTVGENLAGSRGTGITFDAGLMFRRGLIGAGLSARNFGGQMKYAGGDAYPFPTNYGAGVGVTHPGTGLSLALDANSPKAYFKNLRAGVEWKWNDLAALRAGYRHEVGATNDLLTGPSFGLGAGRNGFWLDYGYMISGNGDGEHRMAITLIPRRMHLGSDPFGSQDIPNDYGTDPTKMVGPPVPTGKGKTK